MRAGLGNCRATAARSDERSVGEFVRVFVVSAPCELFVQYGIVIWVARRS